MLRNIAVTKQWTIKWPYIVNVVYRIVCKIMVNKITFVGLRGGDRPSLDPTLVGGRRNSSHGPHFGHPWCR